jgi:hypothetical protein
MDSRLLLFAVILFIGGCTPYQSDFIKCPGAEKGKCLNISGAYIESIQNPPAPVPREREIRRQAEEDRASLKAGGVSQSSKDELFDDYQSARMRREIGALQEPQTPLLSPPTTMRVLFRPYRGEGGELNWSRFTYVIVDEARFVVGDDPGPSAVGGE